MYSSACNNHCIGRLLCAEGYVYDSPADGPVGELDVIRNLSKSKYSEPSWLLTSGKKVTSCRPGCRISSECKKGYKCDTNRAQCVLDTCLSAFSNSSNIHSQVAKKRLDNTSNVYQEKQILELSCPKGHALFDAGMKQKFKGISEGEFDTRTSLECETIDGNRYWRTNQGGKLFHAKCKKMPRCNCLKNEVCIKGQCLPLCELDVLKQKGLEVTAHLESDPNVPKPCCDESYVNGDSIPKASSHLYIPAGDVVRISCASKNRPKRLILNSTFHINGSNCFGDFLDYVCFKIGYHLAEWRILSDPRNDKLPICVDECKQNNNCPSSKYCDVKNCGTCIASSFEPCNINEDCVKNTQAYANNDVLDTRPQQCLSSPITNDLRCMPTCPFSISNTIIDDPYTSGTTRSSCVYHHEFNRTKSTFSSTDKRPPSSLEIYCDRSKYEPVWMVKTENPYPLPPCHFIPKYCSEESLQTIRNGGVKFKPGKIDASNKTKIEPHKAKVQCNEDGYFMTIDDNIWRGTRLNNLNTCQKELELVCSGINETRRWHTEDQDIVNVDDISCSPGCVQDDDCIMPHSYCNQTTCKCEQHQCPDKIENGEIGCTCCHVGFENIFYCDKGYTVAHPDYIIYWYLDCINETTDCTTNQMRPEIDIKCNFDPATLTANWYLDYAKIFDSASPKQFSNITVPAKCVKGCDTDENCPRGEECAAREDVDCNGDEGCDNSCAKFGDCPPGICVPYRCKDYSETWGGSLVGKNFSTVGQKAMFQCKEGYFMPNLSDSSPHLTNKKLANTQIICQKVVGSLIPEWRLGSNNVGREVPQCYKDCRTDEDCDRRDHCNLGYNGGACLPKKCSSIIDNGIVKSSEILEFNENIEPEYIMICHREYILHLEKESEAFRSHQVECKFNLTGRDHMKWVLKESSSLKLPFNYSSTYVESKCQRGCLDDGDCSDYGTECSLNGPSKHTCVLKKCPHLHIADGSIERNLKKVRDTARLVCNKGYIFKSTAQNSEEARRSPVKNSTLLCTLDVNKNPIWVEQDNSRTQIRSECMKGCANCRDCNTDENCVNSVCEKIKCRIHEDETISISEDVDIGYTATAIAKDGFVFHSFDEDKMKCHKMFKVSCQLEKSNNIDSECIHRNGMWNYHPLQMNNSTYQNILSNNENQENQETPSIRVGCTQKSITKDCEIFEHCHDCNCKRRMCISAINNGHLELLNNQNGNDQYSGQSARLVCDKSYFIKVVDTDTILNGQLSNETSVTCKYVGKDPTWVDKDTGYKVKCDKECFKDEDCTKKNTGFCVNHRCKPSCCQLSELITDIGNQELCKKTQLIDETCIPVTEKINSKINTYYTTSENKHIQRINLCCSEGFVIRPEDNDKPTKSSEVICSREDNGAVFLLPNGQGANKSTCEPGCVDKDDCEPREKCSEEGLCKTKTCRFPHGLIGNLKLESQCNIGDNGQAELGCNATFVCDKDHIYFDVLTKQRSRGVKVHCVDQLEEDEGTWKILRNGSPLEPCVEGCLSSDDCIANGMAPCRECHGKNFKCVEKQCIISDPNIKFVKHATASSRDFSSTQFEYQSSRNLITKSSLGAATCKQGYVFMLDHKAASKSMDLQCCDQSPEKDVCRLRWGLSTDCRNVSIQCVKGCVPKSSKAENSDDCGVEEKCVDNKCVPKLCQLPKDKNYKLSDKTSPRSMSYIKVSNTSLQNNLESTALIDLTFHVGSSHELCCDFGYVFYLHTPMHTKCINVTCKIDVTSLEAKFRTSPAQGSLPDCQKGCITNEHCRNSSHEQSICNNGTCTWPCEAIESVENGIALAKDLSLGSKAEVQCSKGYLINHESKRNVTLECVIQNGEGSRWCRIDTGECEIPACTRGCLGESDCGHKEVCKVSKQYHNLVEYHTGQVINSYETESSCTHDMCCEKIVCPKSLSGLNGNLELQYSNNELGSIGKFQCNTDAVYPTFKDPSDYSSYLEPQSWVTVVCIRMEVEDEFGTWVAMRNGDNEPIQACDVGGCNLGDRRTLKPCHISCKLLYVHDCFEFELYLSYSGESSIHYRMQNLL